MSSCPVCTELYDESSYRPLIVGNCGHTMCSTCVNQIFLVRKKLICPMDNRPLNHPADSFADFPTNYALLETLSKQPAKSQNKEIASANRPVYESPQAKPPILHLVRIQHTISGTRIKAKSQHGDLVFQTDEKDDGTLFRIVEIEPYKYGIRTQHVSYLRGDINTTVNHVGHLQTWETWRIQHQENGSYIFKSFHNTYLTFNKDKKSIFLAAGPSLDGQFEIIVVPENNEKNKEGKDEKENGSTACCNMF